MAKMVSDRDEKAAALNALVEKSQTEGGYEKLRPDTAKVKGVGRRISSLKQ